MFRWGIIGCGSIAHKFIESLKLVNNGILLAVASRTLGNAKKFAQDYDIPYYYNSYEKLVQNPEIDVIYIATTHNMHYENMKLCISHGKHVLCEKTFTLNEHQTQDIITLAKKFKVFVMEAMWMRFMPAIVAVCELLKNGIIGPIYSISANFGYRYLKLDHTYSYRFFKPVKGSLVTESGSNSYRDWRCV
ncbi:MAG: Gfo/Idh/MocA family protein [Promethearchaeota archaeon]